MIRRLFCVLFGHKWEIIPKNGTPHCKYRTRCSRCFVLRKNMPTYVEALGAIGRFKEHLNRISMKESPWISVKERLPETNEGQSLYEVIVATSDRRFFVVVNTEVEHLVGLLGVTHWMYIPEV